MTYDSQAEWEEAFNPAIYTGELDILDFDMAEFTGPVPTGPSFDLYVPGAGAASATHGDMNSGPAIPYAEKSSQVWSANDLSDLDLGRSSAFPTAFQWPQREQQNWHDPHNTQYQ